MSPKTKLIATISISGLLAVTAACIVHMRKADPSIRACKTSGLPHESASEQELRTLCEGAKARPNDKLAQWNLANAYLKYNMLEKAADQFHAIVHLDKTDVNAKLKLADICLASKEYRTAESHYLEAAKQKPNNCAALQGLCASLIRQHRFFEATATAKQALAINKDDIGTRMLYATALSDFVLQYPNPLSHRRELNLAQRTLAGLADEMPNNGDLFYQYGRIERALLHRDASIQQLERAHILAPKNAEVSRMLATSYHEIRKDDQALKLLNEAVSYEPDNPGVNDLLGRILIDSPQPGSAERAIEIFKKALAAAPYDARATEHLAAAYDKLGDLQNARLAYERSTQLDPYRASPFQKLALVYTRLGETKLAQQAATIAEHVQFNEQQFRRVMELSTQHPTDVNLHLIMADRYRDMNMPRQARDEYYLVLKLDPNSKRVPKEFRVSSNEIPGGL